MPHRSAPWVQGLSLGVFVCALLGLAHSPAPAATFCVSTAAELASALLTAATNGETDVVQMVQGTYQGNFTYASSEAYGLTLEGGYVAGCASRIVDPKATVLDGMHTGTVLAFKIEQTVAVDLSVEGLTLQHGAGGASMGGGADVDAFRANPTLTNNIISQNVGVERGGLRLWGETITLTNNIITGNVASSADSYSGGLEVSGSTVILTNNTITGNTGTGTFSSGGLKVYGSTGVVMLMNNTITGNTGGIGGGDMLAPTITLTNNIVSQNVGAGLGVWAGSTATLTNNTITGNVGRYNTGGLLVGIYESSGQADIYNNIIWNNRGAKGADLYLDPDGDGDGQPAPVNLLHNDFDQSEAGTFMTVPFPIDPSNLNNVDPRFVDAAGGDYHLQASSPVIDQGDNSAPGLPLTDQEGRPRILQGTVDLGALEFSGAVDTVQIPQAIFLRRFALLSIHATSSAAPEATLFVTIPGCIMHAPMTYSASAQAYEFMTRECRNLDGQAAMVTSSFGGSDTKTIR